MRWKTVGKLAIGGFLIGGLLGIAQPGIVLRAQEIDVVASYDCHYNSDFYEVLDAVTEPLLRNAITVYKSEGGTERTSGLLLRAGMRQPENSLIASLRGVISNDAYLYEQAATDLTAAIGFDPDLGFNYEFRAEAYYGIGEYEQSIDDIEMALTFYPDRAILYKTRADDYFALGQLDKALDDYDHSVELDSACIDTYLARAYYYNQAEDYPMALSDLDKALEIDSHNLYALTLSGFVYRQTGERMLALANLNAVLAINPDYGDAYWGLGYVYEDQSRLVDALNAYQRYVSLAGDSANDYVLGRIQDLETQLGTGVPATPTIRPS